MDKGRNLLPWIFGGLSMAAAAIAITVASSNGGAPNRSHAPIQTTAHISPDAQILPAPQAVALPKAVPAAPAPVSTPAPTLAAAPTQSAAPPTQPTSRVWECTINGQKTFSDAPCGDKSSVREIGPINRMDPSPLFSYARPYGREPSYQPEYSDPGEQPDATAEQQFAGNPYPVYVGIPVREHARPNHAHRPHGHSRGPQPRKN